MSVEVSRESIEVTKQTIEYLMQILRGDQQESHYEVDSETLQLIISKLDSLGMRIAEIHQSLQKYDYSFERLTQSVVDYYGATYKYVLDVSQQSAINTRYDILEKFVFFKSAVLNVDAQFKIHVALNRGSTSPRKYTESEVELKIQEFEKEKSEKRKQLYLKADNNLKKLEDAILKTNNPPQLDNLFAKILHICGFDSEIYNHIQGNVDIIAVDHLNNQVILVETTTGNVNKSKVEQIVVRKKEYEKSDIFENPPNISLLIVTNKDKKAIDSMGRNEARINEVGIFTSEQIQSIISLIRKCKLFPDELLKIIRKNIPT